MRCAMKVVVTGLGAICPLGADVETSWKNLVAGTGGIRRITRYDVSDWPVKIAGTAIDFDPQEYVSAKDLKRLDQFTIYGIAATKQAITDAGLEITEENACRTGVAVGSGIGGLVTIENNHRRYMEKGVRKISPMIIPASIINIVAGHISMLFNIKGINLSLVSACATGAYNIASAAHAIIRGDADIVVAGGTEMAICPLGVGGFAAARALATSYNDAPEKASRPWDINREGFVIGEGAGILVLENEEHAKKRGANIYCELAGIGYSSDAYHVTMPEPSGAGAASCMNNAMQDAGVNIDDIEYINAHGTSTPAGDLAETLAIKSAFKDHAKRLAISSCKSMTGHLLGASSSLEAIFSILTLRDNILPPTINLDDPDPECDLDYIPHTARRQEVRLVLSNSFGFGGANSTLIFKKL